MKLKPTIFIQKSVTVAASETSVDIPFEVSPAYISKFSNIYLHVTADGTATQPADYTQVTNGSTTCLRVLRGRCR